MTSDDKRTETRSTGTGPADSPAELLWHAVCDLYPGVEVASRHAFEDFLLNPEDRATLDKIRDLRQKFRKCEAAPAFNGEDMHFLAVVDQRLASLEGRAEILLLAVS